MMKLNALFLIIFHSSLNCFAQDIDDYKDSYERFEIILTYSDFKGYTFTEDGRRKKKYLKLYGEVNDSISVYVDNCLIATRYIQYDKNLASDLLARYSLGKLSKKFHWVDIVFHKSKEYIEFPVDQRYFVIDVHLSDDGWTVIYNNNY